MIGAVHFAAARLDGRFRLLAGALSSDPQRARRSAAAWGIADGRCYSDFKTMAEREAARDDGIDAVAIVTPNHLHFAPAMAFLDAGIDVICDKPLTTTLADAETLAAKVRETGRVFVLTHNYTGYGLVRTARAMVADGELGPLRVVQVEYPQEWLSLPIENEGQKQAGWRTDPARSGAGGSVADIGTHAANLLEFVSGQTIDAVAADVDTFVPGRRIDDNVNVLLRMSGGAKGMLWASQVVPGNDNALRLRVYGEKAGIEWHQEYPERLRFAPRGEPARIITQSGQRKISANADSGFAGGHLRGFAQIYQDAAELIQARIDGREADAQARLAPGVAEGVRGMRFVEAVLASGKAQSAWKNV